MLKCAKILANSSLSVQKCLITDKLCPTKEMRQHFVSLQHTASNKVPKDTNKNQFFAKLSVMFGHNTGPSFYLGIFFI